MFDFYTRFYLRTRESRAYALFCEQVCGRNLGQHGPTDMDYLVRKGSTA